MTKTDEVNSVAGPSDSLTTPRKSAKKVSIPRWLLASMALIVMSIIGAAVYFHNSHKVEYLTAPVDRSDIQTTVTTTGNLNAVVTVQVGSQVSGNIIALYADFNTKVKKGQLVALIDPAPFKAAVDQATASLAAAKAAVVTAQATLAKSQSDVASALANVASQKANLAKSQSAVGLAKIENERRKVLLKQNATSQEDADTAQAAYDQAVAVVDAARAAWNAAQASAESADRQVDVARTQLDQAHAVVDQDEAVLAQAQLNLDHTRIVAPVDGTVQSRNMDVGQTVAASFQSPIIFLIAQDLTKMQVDTNVDESDVGPIRLGQLANFTVDAYPGEVFPGKVGQIREAPINVQNVITYDVVIGVSNPDQKLFPGMTANVTIFTGRVLNALRIPKAALRFRPRTARGARTQGAPGRPARQPVGSQAQQMQTIYVLDSRGQPKPVLAKLGVSDANYIEVVSGLAEGQQVVVGMVTQAAPADGAGTRRLGL